MFGVPSVADAVGSLTPPAAYGEEEGGEVAGDGRRGRGGGEAESRGGGRGW